MTFRSLTRWRLLNVVLAGAALLLFVRLALRHVGDSYFLADQVDQLQKFEALLRLDPDGLWGPAMSGTTARALGPFGAFVFGLPVALGFGIDAVHVFTSLLLVIAAGIAFWQLARTDIVFAWVWLIVLTSMRMVWWNAAMFWVNTLLLPLGLLLLALFAAMVRRPSVPKIAATTLVLMCALQQHLIALVGIPVLLVAIVRFWTSNTGSGLPRPRGAGSRPRASASSAFGSGVWRAAIAIGTVVAVGLIPYAIAEGRTRFENTRAMFSHVDAAAHSSSAAGRQAALDTLVLATDPMTLLPSPGTAITFGALVASVAVLLLLWRRRHDATVDGTTATDALLWLVTAAVVSIAGQALFFLLMARPLNGLHYAMLLAPWYPVPLAALVAGIVPRRGSVPPLRVAVALGFVSIALLIGRGPTLADRYAERTAWTYRAIVGALDSLCAGEAVNTLEGQGLVNELTPSSDSVLRYVMKRGYAACRYNPASTVLIVANRTGMFDPSIESDGRRFVRERVVEPGLARYRLADP